jgi:hypothetical protein
MKVSKKKHMLKCNKELVVHRYGGGYRYYCPSCDVSKGFYPMSVFWTNGTPPKDRKCDKVIKQ